MLDPITVLILKVVASACVRFYVSSLLGAGQITYDSDALGYKIPKWYMNPGKPKKEFYSYGTSVSGDEFESLTDAQRQAVGQMAQHIRLSNRAIIEKEVHYDANSVKQRRLIELFVRGEGLEEFIRHHAKLDKKQLVAVERPEDDMRAFVRMELKAKDYIAFQAESLNELKTRLMQQKSDDILVEMEAELAAWEKEAATHPGNTIPGFKPGDIAPPPTFQGPDAAVPATAPIQPYASPDAMPGTATGNDDPWRALEKELDREMEQAQ